MKRRVLRSLRYTSDTCLRMLGPICGTGRSTDCAVQVADRVADRVPAWIAVQPKSYVAEQDAMPLAAQLEHHCCLPIPMLIRGSCSKLYLCTHQQTLQDPNGRTTTSSCKEGQGRKRQNDSKRVLFAHHDVIVVVHTGHPQPQHISAIGRVLPLILPT